MKIPLAEFYDDCTCRGYEFPDGTKPLYFNNIKTMYKKWVEIEENAIKSFHAPYYAALHLDNRHLFTFHDIVLCGCGGCKYKRENIK